MADPEPDEAAGDYVLGLMAADERAAFLRRLAREPATAAAVVEWQQRLAPLALGLDPVAPPDGLWPRIERSIGPVPANDVSSRAGPGLWRPAAIAAGLVALVLGGLTVQRSTMPPPAAPIVAQAPAAGGTMLAALSSKGETPGLFIRYDRATDHVTVMPMGMGADAAHSLELWMIRGKASPEAMWLLDPARPSQHAAKGRIKGDVIFAVSREPQGGSPTGQPTGPVIYSGALMPMPQI